MLYLIAIVYWLLLLRVFLRMEASFVNGKGNLALFIGTMGVMLRRDYVLVRGKKPFSLRVMPCDQRKKSSKSSSVFLMRMAKKVLLDPYLGRRTLALHLRLGLGDACETAIAAGAVRALLCTLASGSGILQQWDLRVTPDFSGWCLHGQMTGIFSARLGDIMLASLKAASGKKREGLKWRSIPLRV